MFLPFTLYIIDAVAERSIDAFILEEKLKKNSLSVTQFFSHHYIGFKVLLCVYNQNDDY